MNDTPSPTQTAPVSSSPITASPRIVVVDDDAELRQLIGDFLSQSGCQVRLAADAREMDQCLAQGEADLVVLDYMMPGEDGLSACQRLTKTPGGPAVIMLSARSDDIDRIVGLELGADDYMAKPFHPRELLARVRSVLRRRAQTPSPRSIAITKFLGWQLDNIRRVLTRPNGVEVALSNAEFELLRVFIDRPGRILSRDQILDHLHGPAADSFDRAIDVQISRLRRKLGEFGREEIIRTVRGVGYMFQPAA